MDETQLAYLAFWVRACAGLLMIAAGIGKGVEPREHRAASVDAYRILPVAASRVLGIALPAIEIGTGAALILGFLMPAPAVFAALLLAAFGVAMIVNLRRGRRVPCSCFGATSESTISWSKAVTDLLAAGILVMATWPLDDWALPLRPFPVGVRVVWPDVVGILLCAAGTLAMIMLVRMSMLLTFRSLPSASSAHRG